MRTAAIFIFALLQFIGQTISHPITAQSSDFLEGVISDSITSEPVAFAQIKLKINNLSIYSNSEGTFRLPKNHAFLSDSIIITGIGFQKYSVSFMELNDRKIKNIRLTPSKRDVVIRVSARDTKQNSISILKRAISNLSTRYPVNPFSYISYYRDYQKKDSSYINLNEAIIQTSDKGFLSPSISNIHQLLDLRKDTAFQRMNLIADNNNTESARLNFFDKLIPESTSNYHFREQLFTLSAQDPIRNFKLRSFPFVEIFSENFIDNHNFSPPSEILRDKQQLLKIAFNGKTTVIGDSLIVSGAIYIQPDDYSIHKLEYSCYDNTAGTRLKKLFSINIEYGKEGPEDSLMYLRYLSMCRLYKVIDTDDKTYFRLRSSTWDLITNINPTLTLNFNNRVDKITATQTENLQIKVGKREIPIKNIQVVGENIYLRFKNEDVKDLTDSCEVYVRVLKDQDGNILAKRIPIEVYQYREVFVQEYNNSAILKVSSAVQDLPSVRDSVPASEGKIKYWMNTPENIKNKK